MIPADKSMTQELTKEAFFERFIAHMLSRGAFYANGDLSEYAREAAITYWDDHHMRAEGPEACVVADIETWKPSPPLDDDPALDGTDAAHPAWWRSHEYTVTVFCQLVTNILNGKDAGHGFNHEPWHTLRRRLLALQPASADVVEALNKCAVQFRFYQHEHEARGTTNSDLKAGVNKSMAEMCEAALASTSPHPDTIALEALTNTLRRISEATPRSTNSATANDMSSWTRAVAATALAAVEKGR